MSSANANANANKKMVNEPNLYIYIPRASLTTTENEVKQLINQSNIALVDYCDLVVVKDPKTKQPVHFSIFIKLIEWNTYSNHALGDFVINGSIKIYLNRTDFWLLLPNKNPLPRTHVNTSQLAASTEKLFEKTEILTEKTDKIYEEMLAQMAEMRQMILLQQEQIKKFEEKLMINEEITSSNFAKMEVNVEYLFRETRVIATCVGLDLDNLDQEFDDQNVIHVDDDSDSNQLEDVKLEDYLCEENKVLDALLGDMFQEELIDAPSDLSKGKKELDDLLMNLFYPHHLNKKVSKPETNVYMDECIFSSAKPASNALPLKPYTRQDTILDLDEIQKRTSPTPTLIEIITENPKRAVESRDFCGNF
jgi:hypothetical protein